MKVQFTTLSPPPKVPGKTPPPPQASSTAAPGTEAEPGPELVLAMQDLEAETAVIWFDEAELQEGAEERKAAEPAIDTLHTPVESLLGFKGVREVYAEGGVRYTQGQQIVDAERLYFNFKESHGLMEEATTRSMVPFHGIPGEVVLRAREMRVMNPQLLRATDAEFTSCPFGRPHYHVRSDQLDYEGSLVEGTPGVIHASGNRLVAGDTTVSPLPPLSWSVGSDPPIPIKSISVGASSRYGGFALIRWGGDISHWFTDNEHREKSGPNAEPPLEANWLVDTNYYAHRGFGSGLGFDYEKKDHYFGKFYTFYIKDRQSEDSDGTPVENNDRGWVYTQNRYFLPEGFQLDAELSYLSEKHLLNEYFENVAKEGKEQETYLYLKKLSDRQGFTLLGRWRLNEFDTQTEYLPRAAFRSIGEPLTQVPLLSDELPGGALLYHTNFSEISNARRRASDQLTGPADFPDERVVRVDTDDTLTLPFDLGPYGFAPYYENRVTYFSRTPDQGAAWRWAGTAGAGLSTQFHRTFEVQSDALGINGIRHIVIPEIDYQNRWATTVASDELFAIDSVEDVDKIEQFLLRLDQRLQTRYGTKPVEVRDFLRFVIEQPIYPNPDRDNAGHTVGPMHAEASLNTWIQPYPIRNLRIFSETDYDWPTQTFTSFGVGVGMDAAEGLSVATSYRALSGIQRVLTGQVGYRIGEKWEISLLEQRDLGENIALQRDVTLRRFDHDFVIDVTYSVDEGKGDRGVAISITPLLLFRERGPASFLSNQRPLFSPDLGP